MLKVLRAGQDLNLFAHPNKIKLLRLYGSEIDATFEGQMLKHACPRSAVGEHGIGSANVGYHKPQSNLGLKAFRLWTRRAVQTGRARDQFQPFSFARSISIDTLAGIDVEIGHLVHVEGEFHLLPRLHRGFCLQTRRHFLA